MQLVEVKNIIDIDDLDPKPKLRIHFEDISDDATQTFMQTVDSGRILPNAINKVLQTLYGSHGSNNIPKVRSITLFLEQMGGVAYTTSIALDDMHKEIHFSLAYLSKFLDDRKRFRDEAIGVVTHEMVHVWQHNGNGKAPGGLIEGIADFVRLKAGLAPPHWKKDREFRGKKWDDGYQKTAWFLEWLAEKYGEGTVSKINETLGQEDYNEVGFWHGLFEKSVDELYVEYRLTWDKPPDEDNDQEKPNEEVGEQP